VLPGVALLVTFSVGSWRLSSSWDGGPALRVGVIQASVAQRDRFQADGGIRTTLRHAQLTRELVAREELDLVVWSETAVDSDLDTTRGLATLLRRVAGEGQVPLVTGAPRSVAGRRTNSVVLVDPRGVSESYDKQRLVPFSEYDPELTGFLAPLLGPVTEGPAYRAGSEATIFHGAGIPLATPVCFEVTDPDLMRRFRGAGAKLFVNLSNDAWFGRSGYADMHWRHVIFRAIELRSWIVRGANTGVSGAVDPTGRVVARLPVFEEGSLVATVHAAGPPTFYSRHGSAPAVAGLGVLAATALLAGRGKVSSQRSGSRSPS
jgi:apolipoprotein N-acyltransferase